MQRARIAVAAIAVLFVGTLWIGSDPPGALARLAGAEWGARLAFLHPWIAAMPWVVGGFLADRLLRSMLLGRRFRASHGNRESPRLLHNLLSSAIALAAVFGIVAVAFGLSIAGLVATSGVLTVVLGFALKETIADFFSGLALSLERPYEIGDWVEAGGDVGCVTQITWRATHLVTQSAKEIVVPNRIMADGAFVNYSRPKTSYREDISLVLGNEHEPRRIEDIIHAAILATPDVVSGAPHRVRIDGFTERGTVWKIKVWLESYEKKIPAVHHVCANVIRHLRTAGIEIPYQRMEFVETGATLAGLHDAGRRRDAVRVLDRVEILAALEPEERRRLAGAARERALPAGSTLLRQDEAGGSLFVLVEGALEVFRRDGPDAPERAVGRILPGEVVGEMWLLSAAPRTATVRAVTGAVVLEVAAADIAEWFQRRPELADRMAAVVARREAANADARGRQGAVSGDESRTTLAERIRSFFRGL